MPSPSRRDVLRAAIVLAASGSLAACGKSGDDGAGADGVVTVDLWHGQVDTGKKAIDALIKEFNQTHPKIKVVGGGGGVTADSMLQKVTAGLAAGSYPDIAYIFGSDLASMTRSPQVADLTSAVDLKDVLAGRAGRRHGEGQSPRDARPAGLALRCLQQETLRGCRSAGAEGRLDLGRLRRHRAKLTNPGQGRLRHRLARRRRRGHRLAALADDLGPRRRRRHRGRQEGRLRAGRRAGPGTLDKLRTDKSLYVDPKPGGEQLYQVFLGGRMGMVATGPWQLPDVDRKASTTGSSRCRRTPASRSRSPAPTPGPCSTTAPPRSRPRPSSSRWLTHPKQDVRWDIQGGSLPLTTATAALPEWKKHSSSTTGLQTFVDSLETARVRPTITAYPQISQHLGQAIVAVLLGKKSPADALKECVEQSNTILAVPN